MEKSEAELDFSACWLPDEVARGRQSTSVLRSEKDLTCGRLSMAVGKVL